MGQDSSQKGLYIHIPFCLKKCVYCDFYSVPITPNAVYEFIKNIIQEIELRAVNPPFGGFTFSTIYIGGGTPSLFTASQIDQILTAINKQFGIGNNAEITLETNPATVTEQSISDYRNLGVNRLSIGIQSFNDGELRLLGRPHSAQDGLLTYELARKAGYENINIDLIFGSPKQTLTNFDTSLNTALNLAPEHIALYELTVEQNTPLARSIERGDIIPLDADSAQRMYFRAIEKLGEQGYEHYEISNFATSQHQCKHNIGYWRHIPYLGLGPSAHSFCNNQRSWNVKSIEKYNRMILAHDLAIEGTEELTTSQRELETIFLSLRTSEGINLQKFKKEYNIDFSDKYSSLINILTDKSEKPLAILTALNFRLTSNGFSLHNEICRLFAQTIDI